MGKQSIVSLTAKKNSLYLTSMENNFYNNNLNSLTTIHKIAEFANSVGLDEVAHNEPPHQDLHCLPSSLCLLNLI